MVAWHGLAPCATISRVDDAGFWRLISLLDWSHAGDDDLVVAPVVAALAEESPDQIQGFHEALARKLHALDGREWARHSGPGIWWGEPRSLSEDGFLYARCVVVANGRAFFERVLGEPGAMPKDMEFEALLYVASQAMERKTGRAGQLDAEVSYETFANATGWT
jgi:hypothetical protein